jgi:hypothetical protein
MSGGSPRIHIPAVDDHPLVGEGIAGLVGVQPPPTHRCDPKESHVGPRRGVRFLAPRQIIV